jgi:Protein of unknown function (DUF1569)
MTASEQQQVLLSRLAKLQPDSARRWGKMSVNEMLCHLSDSYLVCMTDPPAPFFGNWFTKTILRFIALHSGLPWTKGIQTSPRVDPQKNGTKPTNFSQDKQKLEAVIRRFYARKRDFQFSQHPMFGQLSESEWLKWGYLHADLHFRQFGI